MGLKRTSSLKRGGRLNKGWLKKKGHRGTLWDVFVEQERKKARNAEGLIACEDYRLGLPACHRSIPTPDLHHTEGRDGALLLDRSKMVWLTRDCHKKAEKLRSASHNSDKPVPEAPYDAERHLEETSSSPSVFPVQGRTQTFSKGDARRTVYSSVQRRHAPIVERKKEGGI